MANDLLEFMNSRLVSSLEFIFRTKQRCFFFFFFIFLNISCDVSYCLQFFFFFSPSKSAKVGPEIVSEK